MIQPLMTQGFKKYFGVDFNLQFFFELHLLIIKPSEKDSILAGRNVGNVLLRVISIHTHITKRQMPETASFL